MSEVKWSKGQRVWHTRSRKSAIFMDVAPQEQWVAEGWRAAIEPAESPAAPVERALAVGWAIVSPQSCACRSSGECSDEDAGVYLYVGLGYKYPYCEKHAADNRAFAEPAPLIRMKAGATWPPGTVTVVVDECSEAEYRMTGTNSDWVKWTAEPAPKPAPRCKRFDCDRTDDRIAMRFSTKGSAAEPVCQKCHLDTEQRIAHAEEAYREIRKWDADNRPRATVGVVPVVFGLSVGILSRGML